MFEQGVIRPPSEASSLLVRVTRNCPWNRCHICPAYKGKKFSRRTVEEIKHDIDEMAKEYSSFSERFTSAFLQDADSLILPTDELVEILEYIKKVFPNVERVTTYARAKSMITASEGGGTRSSSTSLKYPGDLLIKRASSLNPKPAVCLMSLIISPNDFSIIDDILFVLYNRTVRRVKQKIQNR